VPQRCLKQRIGLSVTADHPVECDNRGWRELRSNINEIGVKKPNRRGTIASSRFLCRSVDVSWRRIDAGGRRHPSVEQLERQAADSRADVEKRTTHRTSLGKLLPEQTRRRCRSFRAIAIQVPRSDPNRELLFRRVGEIPAAARHSSSVRSDYRASALGRTT
jgi:hypothetical protein